MWLSDGSPHKFIEYSEMIMPREGRYLFFFPDRLLDSFSFIWVLWEYLIKNYQEMCNEKTNYAECSYADYGWYCKRGT